MGADLAVFPRHPPRRKNMPQDHENPENSIHQHHQCGDLFGCGEEKGTGIVREDIKDAAVTRCTSDRLLHMDEIHQEQLDGYLSFRGRSRRNLLRASGFMGVLAAVGPWFEKLAYGSLADDKKQKS